MSINPAWLETALTAADLTAWTQTMLLTDDPELARAEPKTALPAAAHRRPDHRGQRRIYLRLAKLWPWALALARAFTRLRLIPLPA